jgi:hypothetical protein
MGCVAIQKGSPNCLTPPILPLILCPASVSARCVNSGTCESGLVSASEARSCISPIRTGIEFRIGVSCAVGQASQEER